MNFLRGLWLFFYLSWFRFCFFYGRIIFVLNISVFSYLRDFFLIGFGEGWGYLFLGYFFKFCLFVSRLVRCFRRGYSGGGVGARSVR